MPYKIRHDKCDDADDDVYRPVRQIDHENHLLYNEKEPPRLSAGLKVILLCFAFLTFRFSLWSLIKLSIRISVVELETPLIKLPTKTSNKFHLLSFNIFSILLVVYMSMGF